LPKANLKPLMIEKIEAWICDELPVILVRAFEFLARLLLWSVLVAVILVVLVVVVESLTERQLDTVIKFGWGFSAGVGATGGFLYGRRANSEMKERGIDDPGARLANTFLVPVMFAFYAAGGAAFIVGLLAALGRWLSRKHL
jgi:hypothetical protein